MQRSLQEAGGEAWGGVAVLSLTLCRVADAYRTMMSMLKLRCCFTAEFLKGHSLSLEGRVTPVHQPGWWLRWWWWWFTESQMCFGIRSCVFVSV